MYRGGEPVFSEDHVNFVLVHHALGDAITSLPAIRYAASNNPEVRFTAWASPFQVPLFERLVPTVRWMNIEEFAKVQKEKNRADLAGPATCNTPVPMPTMTRNRFDMVDFAYHTLLDMVLDPEDHFNRRYPYEAPLGSPPGPRTLTNYVVIPTGATCAPGAFKAHVMEPVIDWLLAHGYHVALTGRKQTVVNGKTQNVHDYVDQLPAALLAQCTDLRDQLSLMQLRDLCGHARAVAGVDGGTLHVAGTTSVPIVYACTRAAPKHRPIIRQSKNWRVVHITPRDLECTGCQAKWILKFQHDFSRCAYGDSLCTDRLHPDDFIDGLKSLGL